MTRGPPRCPDCGHDPSGDEEEFTSGGGWIADHSVMADAQGTIFVEELRCPECRTIVSREEER